MEGGLDVGLEKIPSVNMLLTKLGHNADNLEEGLIKALNLDVDLSFGELRKMGMRPLHKN